MCGIFGYIGEKNTLQICLKGLKQLEYRGYDSAGIAGIKNNNLIFCKTSGKIFALEKKIEKQNLELDIAIAHTRWATHGKPDEKNAHPHFDTHLSLGVVHNGIIENYAILKDFLKNKNIKFSTETDTEVIAQLISYNYEKYKNNLYLTVHESLKLLKGSFAIALIHKDHPNIILAAARESPLAIGFIDNKNEILISSDPNAFIGHNLNVFYLRNDEIALLSKKSIKTYTNQKKLIEKKTSLLEGKNQTFSKEGFDHFLLKEIFEQPITIQKAMLGNISEDFGTAYFEGLKFSSTELMAIKHIIIIACGTSWHAAYIGASLLEDKARILTTAEIASEFRFKNPIISEETLIIAISQSGETADTLSAVKEAKAKGAKILGICNVKNSTLTREAHSCIYLNAGPEISVCSSKAFTSQITILSLFTLLMARLRHFTKEDGQKFLSELKKIPKIINQVLEKQKEIKKISIKYSKYKNFFFIGRKYMYASCLEAALKLKEISYLNATSYPAGELKHGPIALINKNLPVIAFCSNKQTYDKTLNNLMELKAREAPILAIAPNNAKEILQIADDIIFIPNTIDELAIFPTTIVGQLFAYNIAKAIGIKDIDQPRNLAKSVTVE
ncbi:MAG: glutamine amidotransferase [Chlamydiae bacterium SM23_39]|nr:MAG: glutamine amidotransferase [Chlamydiae bacterium SM23_39]